MRTSPWLREILTLDPERDAQRIVHLDTVYEFPFDTTRSLEFALFRTFASPAVSRLLDDDAGVRGAARSAATTTPT